MIFEAAEKLPPCVCRVHARKNKGSRPMSCRDLAKASGLSIGTISELSQKTSWKGVPIETVQKFSKACGVDLLKPGQAIKWFRKAKKENLLRMGPGPQGKFFRKLLLEKLPSLKRSTPDRDQPRTTVD